MNNAKLIENNLAEEQQIDVKPMLRKRQEEIAKIIEAIDAISQSNYWKFLEKEVFVPVLSSSVNQLCNEMDEKKMLRLQGKIEVLNRYVDFKRFSEAYRMELKKVEEQLKVAK